jgi:hypothetical protein
MRMSDWTMGDGLLLNPGRELLVHQREGQGIAVKLESLLGSGSLENFVVLESGNRRVIRQIDGALRWFEDPPRFAHRGVGGEIVTFRGQNSEPLPGDLSRELLSVLSLGDLCDWACAVVRRVDAYSVVLDSEDFGPIECEIHPALGFVLELRIPSRGSEPMIRTVAHHVLPLGLAQPALDPADVPVTVLEDLWVDPTHRN